MDAKTYEYMKKRVDQFDSANKHIDSLRSLKSFALNNAKPGAFNSTLGVTYGNGTSNRFIPAKYSESFARAIEKFIDECIELEEKEKEEI